jgi:hypothetical protein
MVDLVQSGGGAPVGVLPDIYLARPVVAAWVNQHLTCLMPAIETPRPKRSGTRSGAGCGPGPWAAQREITGGWWGSTPRGGRAGFDILLTSEAAGLAPVKGTA